MGEVVLLNGQQNDEPDILECLQDYQLMLTAIAQRHRDKRQRAGAFNKARAVKKLIERLVELEAEENADVPT